MQEPHYKSAVEAVNFKKERKVPSRGNLLLCVCAVRLSEKNRYEKNSLVQCLKELFFTLFRDFGRDTFQRELQD